MHDDDEPDEEALALYYETLDPNRPGCWSQAYIELLTLNEMAHGAFKKWEKEQDYWLVYGPNKYVG